VREGTNAGSSSFVVTMPRYFFDIHDGARSTTDDTGVELDGLEAARQEAARTLGEIARDILPDGDRHEVVIEVKDEAGQRVLAAKLSVSIEPTELPGFSPVA
jgi:hypothetical protein